MIQKIIHNKKVQIPVFLIGCFLILVCLSHVFVHSASHQIQGIEKVPAHSLDYLALGDSECAASISPLEIWRKYGYSGYNCGVPGQRLQDAYYNLQSILERQSPKIIFLESNAFFRDYSMVDAVRDYLQNANEELFPLIKYHDQWKQYLPSTEFDTPQKKIFPLMGVRYKTRIHPYKGGFYLKKSHLVKPIPELSEYYLNQILDLCHKKHIKVIVYTVPSPLCWDYEKHNSVAKFAKEKHLKYLDFNLVYKKIGIDWLHDTKDKGNHLNFYGVVKLTDYLGEYLAKHHPLTNHRGQRGYSYWNKDLKSYLRHTRGHKWIGK